MKLLNEKQFRANGQTVNEYTEKTIIEAKEKCKEISAFWPCGVWYSHSEQDGKLYFEHIELHLKHPTLTLIINYGRWQKGKYHIYADKKLKNITNYTIQDEKKKLKEPNSIGVLTTKKIQDWVTYYEQLYAALELIDKKNNNEKTAFLKSIEDLNPHFWNNGKNGEVIKNGIKLTFQISETHISQNLEIHYEVSSNVENFKKLSANKYEGYDS